MKRLEGVRILLLKELKESRKNKSDSIILNEDVDETYINHYIEEMSEEILELKKEKYREEIKKIKEDEEMKHYIKKTRKILYEGFFLAFIVGLSVNQVTELIGAYKGTASYTKEMTNYTIICSLILITASVAMYFWNFIVHFIKYINKEKE